ncbi:MAG: hypothetical protein AAFQ40_04525 [Cyanobacteria bacterium J06623_5]
MAIVLALLIVGWLLAFALGNQAGFETQPAPEKAEATTQTKAPEAASTSYGNPASAA